MDNRQVKMKKILIVCSYFDGQSTGSLRMRALYDSLCRQGHSVQVFTHFFAGSEKMTGVYAPRDKAISVDHYSSTLGVMYRAYRKLAYYCLGINYHSFYRNFLKVSADQGAFEGLEGLDAVIVSVPQPEFIDVAIAVSNKYVCPLFVDFRDGLTFEPLGRNNWLSSYFNHRLERRGIMNAKAVVTVSDALTNDFRHRYSDQSEFFTITNGFKTDTQGLAVSQIAPQPTVFKDSNGRVNILYSGAIERSRLSIFQSLEAFETAIALLEREIKNRLNIVFVGSYSEREVLKIQTFGTVISPVSRDEIAVAQAQADYLLLFTGPDQSVVTMKLFDYLLARKPIVSIGNAPTPGRILSESGAGQQYSLSAIEDIALALTKLRAGQESLGTDIDDYHVDRLMDNFTQLVFTSIEND